ncbi:cation diffusion facilitator family transporter [Allosphingosinicella indica]|uniref:Ferrous-iron efflux pump FieF n=1 Tax=Allosphingosinicella indica TaxID=941907 RepID=A0A1X7GDK0_9SPHN|nr:cation diffusion facilitator family transporter [Allosphingosinicella indica]SMF68215.1 ferrous-iron efflux pump FieF [Allosphingosinicella indica]
MTRQEAARATISAAIASVATATFLLALKGFAAWHTGSVAMLGSLADTGLDLLASLVTLYGVRIAAEPADHDHRFGHGKAEALAALFQVALITASAGAIAWRAIERLGADAPTTDAEFGIGVSIVAIVATFALLAYQRSVIKKTGSIAIRADNVHYQSDLLLNLSVIAALVLDQFLGFASADPIFGIAIALWLAWGAFKASSHAIDQLMDREWPEEMRERFIAVAAQHPQLLGIHDFRTRHSGSHDFAQFHMHVPADITVAKAHDIVEEVEENLRREFPNVEVLIHVDPDGHVDHPGNALIEEEVVPHWFGKRA